MRRRGLLRIATREVEPQDGQADGGAQGVEQHIAEFDAPARDEALVQFVARGVKKNEEQRAKGGRKSKARPAIEGQGAIGDQAEDEVYAEMAELAEGLVPGGDPLRCSGVEEPQEPAQNFGAVTTGIRVARQQENGRANRCHRRPSTQDTTKPAREFLRQNEGPAKLLLQFYGEDGVPEAGSG